AWPPHRRAVAWAVLTFRHRRRGVYRFKGQRGYNRRNYRSGDSKSHLGTVYCWLLSMDHEPDGDCLDVVVDICTKPSYGRAWIPVVLAHGNRNLPSCERDCTRQKRVRRGRLP